MSTAKAGWYVRPEREQEKGVRADPAPRWFEERRTVVEGKDGSETILDYDARARLEGDHSPPVPKSWRVERRRVTNWCEVEQ
jgi:hypothetical protein